MNYRHAYHAGNHADILKHAVLLGCIAALQQKETPILLADIYAGTGLTALDGIEARKTAEADAGIQTLRQFTPDSGTLPPLLANYMAAIGKFPENLYPGSPILCARALRPQDRLFAGELHPSDAATLRQNLKPFKRAAVAEQDAAISLRANTPPPERRGLILIDPPFERPDEFDHLCGLLQQGLARWPTGMFLLWYPIKDDTAVGNFRIEARHIATMPGRNWLDIALCVKPEPLPGQPLRLRGSGMFLVNPPWQLAASCRDSLPMLADILAPQGGGWDVTESPAS